MKNIIGAGVSILIIFVLILLVGGCIASVDNSDRDRCIGDSQAAGVNYHWDHSAGCRIEVNGHWYYGLLNPAPSPEQ